MSNVPKGYIPFVNSKGKVVHLHKKTTLKELVKAGIKVRLVDNLTPQDEHWYTAQPEKTKPQE